MQAHSVNLCEERNSVSQTMCFGSILHPTNKLKSSRINLELFKFERVGGIEPPSSAWKADIIATIRHPLSVAVATFSGQSPLRKSRRRPSSHYHSASTSKPAEFSRVSILSSALFKSMMSGRRESNSDYLVPNQARYHYTTPRFQSP